MFVRRLTTSLKDQHWTTIVIELVIVIVGVFIGNWVNDLSQARAEQREATSLVLNLRPQLERFSSLEAGEQAYYRITRGYSNVVLAALGNDHQVSDHEFVVAAYQASQVAGLPIDGQSLSITLGADEVRKVEDPRLRDAIIQVITFNFGTLRADSLQTDYKKHVRELIPDVVQHAIRQSCGDRQEAAYLVLPANCTVALPADAVARAAASLRAHPELADELAYHLSQTDNWLDNLARLEISVRALLALIEERRPPGS